MNQGYCAITGDILHSGHIKFLTACRDLCDNLTVGVMTDACVKKYKKSKPVLPFTERAYVVSMLKMVDRVVPQDTFEFSEALKKEYMIFDSVEHQREGATAYLAYDKSISSTTIKERIIEANNSKCPYPGRNVRKR